jgi:hypothetical protein
MTVVMFARLVPKSIITLDMLAALANSICTWALRLLISVSLRRMRIRACWMLMYCWFSSLPECAVGLSV